MNFGPDDEPPTRICPICGEEIDADDEGCADQGEAE